MGRVRWLVALLLSLPSWLFAQRAPMAPAGETRNPAAVRSPYSRGADLMVPLCPVHFHDSLGTNGIAGPHDQGVTPPKAIRAVPAKMTQDAIQTAGTTHVGNYRVILNAVVDKAGVPTKVCLQKSSGYGLDGSAAAAVLQYHFDPARKDGKPVPMRIPIPVDFVSPNPPESPQPIPAHPQK